MKFTFEEPTNVEEVSKFNNGITPVYGKGTLKGVAWCECSRCVGHLLQVCEGKVVGWFETECSCGRKIDWSSARTDI